MSGNTAQCPAVSRSAMPHPAVAIPLPRKVRPTKWGLIHFPRGMQSTPTPHSQAVPIAATRLRPDVPRASIRIDSNRFESIRIGSASIRRELGSLR